MKTAVAFLVFNRPECTIRTLAAIREARPPRLLVVGDGPRLDRAGEAERCESVRRIIRDGVDWPCEVELNLAERNLGCAARVSSGLNWAFDRAERLVVIEDDCLPAPSFFRLCDDLLERYADDTRVGQISGCLRYYDEIVRPTSYIFTRYGPIWGWASWRRAWRFYDLKLSTWPRFRDCGGLQGVTYSAEERALRTALYNRLFEEEPDTWDYQWGYAKLSQGLLTAMPCRNLIENIGFGADGTHTADAGGFELRCQALEEELVHPEFILPDTEFDYGYSRKFTDSGTPSVWRRAARKLSRFTTKR